MTALEIEKLCKSKEQELLNKYFGKLIKEAAIERPETIGEYTKDLPLKIEEEYFLYLKELWNEINPDKSQPLESILCSLPLGYDDNDCAWVFLFQKGKIWREYEKNSGSISEGKWN